MEVMLISTRRDDCEREAPIKFDACDGKNNPEAELLLLLARGRDDCEGDDLCPEGNVISAIRWECMFKVLDAIREAGIACWNQQNECHSCCYLKKEQWTKINDDFVDMINATMFA